MIEKILYDHYNFIKKLMRAEYNIDKNERILSLRELNFQSKGEIHGNNYQFHRKGCRLEKEGVVYNHDYQKNNCIYIMG
jgi:hypothetical protein